MTTATIKERDANIPPQTNNFESKRSENLKEQKSGNESKNASNLRISEKSNNTIEDLNEESDQAQAELQKEVKPEEKNQVDIPEKVTLDPPKARSEDLEDLKTPSTEIVKEKSDEELSEILLKSQKEEEEIQISEPENLENPSVSEEESSVTPLEVEEVIKVTVSTNDLIPNEETKTEEGSSERLIEALQLEEQPENYCEENEQDLNENTEDVPETRKRNMLELSTTILSYERFFPGRILGNTFVARNNSDVPMKFTLHFSNSGIDIPYIGEKLCDYYACENVNEIEDSYVKHLKTDVDVSEENLSVWNLEDPYTK